MNWFKNIFTSKADTSSDAMTSQELGEYLFNLCHRQTTLFLDFINDPLYQKTIEVNTEEINPIELLIAFMWLYYDLLQGEKYDKSLTQMHQCFMNEMITNCRLPEDGIWQLLQRRYDEYRQCHRTKDGIDFTYKKVAYDICKNILDPNKPKTNLFLWNLIVIRLQNNISITGKSIANIAIKDNQERKL